MKQYRINDQLKDLQIPQTIAKVIGYPLQPEDEALLLKMHLT